MSVLEHQLRHDCDVLVRQVDGQLATLRETGAPAEIALAEHVATALRELIRDTARASAADRARVRAAVHLFVARRSGRQSATLPGARSAAGAGLRRRARSLAEDVRVIDEIMRALGRPDLVVLRGPVPVARGQSPPPLPAGDPSADPLPGAAPTASAPVPGPAPTPTDPPVALAGPDPLPTSAPLPAA